VTWRPTATTGARSAGRFRDHLRFRHPTGEGAKRYNVLQKLAYLVVIFVLLPLIILMGVADEPMMNSALPGWVDLFGGRQAARDAAFRRRVAAGRFRGDPCVRGDRVGPVEPSALDDHGPLSYPGGGT
jgi:thiosulfate reductase cytochrome b subunit